MQEQTKIHEGVIHLDSREDAVKRFRPFEIDMFFLDEDHWRSQKKWEDLAVLVRPEGTDTVRLVKPDTRSRLAQRFNLGLEYLTNGYENPVDINMVILEFSIDKDQVGDPAFVSMMNDTKDEFVKLVQKDGKIGILVTHLYEPDKNPYVIMLWL